MRYLLPFLSVLILSCGDSNHSILPSHTGAINEVVIVMDDYLWEGASGDSLRASLSIEVPGISWSEPLFDVVHINSAAFSRIFKTHRNLIIVQKSSRSKVYFNPTAYAENQWLCVVEYKTLEDLPKLIGQYAPVMSYQIDEKERQRYTSSQPIKRLCNEVSSRFNLHFSLPNKYDLVLDTNAFVWYEYSPKDKEIIKGIFIYEFPLTSAFNASEVLRLRDSVLKTYVMGPTGDSHMTTEYLYPPYVYTHSHQNLNGLNIRGLWKMQNAFMGGAFVGHYFKDTTNNRGLALEGFLFNPGEDKRNSLQELEWLISDFKMQSSEIK